MAFGSDAPGMFINMIVPVAFAANVNLHVHSGPSGITLALSLPKIPTRRVLTFAGKPPTVGRLATSVLLATVSGAAIDGSIVQSGLPFTFSATLSTVESNSMSLDVAEICIPPLTRVTPSVTVVPAAPLVLPRLTAGPELPGVLVGGAGGVLVGAAGTVLV